MGPKPVLKPTFFFIYSQI